MGARFFALSHPAMSASILLLDQGRLVSESSHLISLCQVAGHNFWCVWGKATVFLGKHSASKFLLAPLIIWGEGLTVSFFFLILVYWR